MAQIPLRGLNGKGKFAQVDDDDFVYIKEILWYYRDGYAVGRTKKGKHVKMHRLVMNENRPGYVIDHINRDRLDNRKQNLRRYTPKENANNTSRNLRFSCWGEEKTLAEWVEDERCRVGYNVVYSRLRRGEEPETALTRCPYMKDV